MLVSGSAPISNTTQTEKAPGLGLVINRLEALWAESMKSAGLDLQQAELIFPQIVRVYSAPERAYHNLRHLYEMAEYLVNEREQISRWTACVTALFYHDYSYDPRSKENVSESAYRSKVALVRLKASDKLLDDCEAFILASEEHQASEGDGEINHFINADLSILASPSRRYTEYAFAIRKEFAHQDDMTHAQRREAFIVRMLGGERIFVGAVSDSNREDRARENLTRELTMIRSYYSTGRFDWNSLVM